MTSLIYRSVIRWRLEYRTWPPKGQGGLVWSFFFWFIWLWFCFYLQGPINCSFSGSYLYVSATKWLLKGPVCSDWSAVTGLSRPTTCFLYFSRNLGRAEGGDCVVVTSQPHRCPDSSFWRHWLWTPAVSTITVFYCKVLSEFQHLDSVYN